MAATEKDQSAIEKAKQLNNIPWCDEYEKMISGMLYDSFVSELEAGRFRARAWCHKFNNWFPHEDPTMDFRRLCEARRKLLPEIFGAVGPESTIEPPFICDYGSNIRIGSRFFANFGCIILDCGLVEIGDRVMFGPNVHLYAATHETEVESRRKDIEYTRPIVIEDDVWVGGQAVILPGVTIGKGSTVSAASVVTRDVPPWSVVRGAPARVVKQVTPVEDLPKGT
ncbi:hypothetical protein LTS08_007547 [Lithohypha guttulata]|nr:hypothetical protein LTR51_002678 [Lithohypha guttulata]KAK5096674.1 hypothetical protein LTS08_007547 [Lithohypha guttulata]